MRCVAAFVCKSTYPMQVVFEVKVHASPVTVYSLFAKGIFNKENPLFIGVSVSRLMFCYHSMIYTALNLNNNLCLDSASYRWNESEVSSSKSSLERSH